MDLDAPNASLDEAQDVDKDHMSQGAQDPWFEQTIDYQGTVVAQISAAPGHIIQDYFSAEENSKNPHSVPHAGLLVAVYVAMLKERGLETDGFPLKSIYFQNLEDKDTHIFDRNRTFTLNSVAAARRAFEELAPEDLRPEDPRGEGEAKIRRKLTVDSKGSSKRKYWYDFICGQREPRAAMQMFFNYGPNARMGNRLLRRVHLYAPVTTDVPVFSGVRWERQGGWDLELEFVEPTPSLLASPVGSPEPGR